MQKSLIFTEGFGCGKILKVALDSFHKHHNLKVFVFGTPEDFSQLTPNENNVLIDCSRSEYVKNLYKSGHAGTAFFFGKVFGGNIKDMAHAMTNNYDGEMLDAKQVIHFDSDIFFKKESISLIETEFENGFDIIGSRRCYFKNPGKVPLDPSIPDSMSTYFFGMNINTIPKQDDQEFFRKMCQGAANPLGHTILDFFDPVVFVAMKNGAKIKFLEQNKIGGQNENGTKESSYKSNLHLDLGSHLAHFGGVGSGYAYFKNKGEQNQSYGDWALGRWAIFAKIFYDENIPCGGPVYWPDGRWVHGGYDQELYNLITSELNEN